MEIVQRFSESSIGNETSPNLTYNGGKILTDPNFASIYYGKYWNTPAGASDAQYLSQFAEQIVDSPYVNRWREYGSGAGKFVGDDTVIPKSDPRVVRERDIRRIVESELRRGNIAEESGQTVYSVLLPPGVELQAPGGASSLEGLGGYHGSYDSPKFGRVYYTAAAYSAGENGIDFNGNPRDNITTVLSHEWTESVTDPDVNNGKLGWYDELLGEVSDIPVNLGIGLKNILGRVLGFAVQKNWSNKDRKVEI